MILPDSVYAKRMPIGKKANIDRANPDQLRRFYLREYQAQRMTVMVVGDVEPQQVEQLIQDYFSSVSKGDKPREQTITVSSKPLREYVNRDMSIAQSTLRWSWRVGQIDQNNADSLVKDYQDEVLINLLRQRLNAKSRTVGSVLQAVSADQETGFNWPTRDIEILFQVEVKDNQLKDGLRELYREFVRAERFGFSDGEIAMAIDSNNKGRSKVLSNRQWIGRMLAHVRHGYYLNTPQESMSRRAIYSKSINSSVLQKRMGELLNAPDQVVYVLQPYNLYSLTPYTLSSLSSMIEEIKAEPLTPTVINQTTSLVMAKLDRQPIAKQQKDLATGGIIYTLSNGLQILVVPPQSASEKIALIASSPLGMINLSDKRYLPAARILPGYAVRAGMGDSNGSEVNQYLENHPATFYQIIGIDNTLLIGKANRDELDTVLQLLYLTLIAPRDQASEVKISSDKAYQQELASINTLYLGLNSLRYGEEWPMPTYWQRSDFDATLADIIEVRKQLLSNPADFKYVLTGVEPTQALPVIEQYLGNLQWPSKAKPLTAKKLSNIVPSQQMQRVKSDVAWRILQANMPIAASVESNQIGDALAELIHARLNQELREVSGEIYNIAYSSTVSPSQGLLLNFEFKHNDDKCKEIASAVERTLSSLYLKPPTEAQAAAANENTAKKWHDEKQQPLEYAFELARAWQWADKLPAQLEPQSYSADTLFYYLNNWLGPSRWTSGAFNCTNDINFDKLKPKSDVKQ
ncbi:M16 family metallopeptidase [Chitinibacter bivalviorum]|uniref:M16 family metallopeptidase n=1 Tax=Chitinibacter bivalviorum TaxID=2739434 RepID=UPI001FE2D832|nr:insulinase family protein [Chitinibacter bivalviorum]